MRRGKGVIFGRVLTGVLILCVGTHVLWQWHVLAAEPSNSGSGRIESETEIVEKETNIKETSSDHFDDETDETEGKDPNEAADSVGRLKIEDTGIYTGMTKAYKDGYEPVVSDGKVSIVLPIIINGGGRVSELTVTPNLGDTASSPFVYKNYQKTFKETEEIVDGEKEKRRVFLISYDFALSDERTNGNYPVIFDITGNGDGSELTQSFTVYVRITDQIQENVDDDGQGDVAIGSAGEEEENPQSQPKLIISKCTSKPESIEAGSEFSLVVEIKNTNKKFYVQNMTIEVSWTEPGLTLEEDSKTFFVEELGSDETMQLPLKFKCSSNVGEGRYDITFNMSYDNPEAVSLTSTGVVSVDVHQAMRAELEADIFPDSINAGDTFTLAVQAMNLGREKIYNARCTVDVPGLSAGTSTFFGNIEAGNAASGQLKIFAGMKDEAVYGSTYGETSGQLLLTYEDEAGNVYTEELPVNTKVNPLVIQETADPADEKETAGLGVQWLVGVVVLGAAAVAGIAFVRKRGR